MPAEVWYAIFYFFLILEKVQSRFFVSIYGIKSKGVMIITKADGAVLFVARLLN
jgi:hypothetical protein